MSIVFTFITLLLALSFGTVVQAGTNDSPIDERLVKEVDVTGDGKPDKVILHLKAKNVTSPFAWTLSVATEGKTIYSHTSDDTWLNKFFGDKGYVADCQGYIECKRKYYYRDLLSSVILTGNNWFDTEGILDKTQTNTLYPLGRKQLKSCCNIEGPRADAILRKIELKLRAGTAVALSVLESPVHAKPPVVFAPEVGRFIVIYEE